MTLDEMYEKLGYLSPKEAEETYQRNWNMYSPRQSGRTTLMLMKFVKWYIDNLPNSQDAVCVFYFASRHEGLGAIQKIVRWIGVLVPEALIKKGNFKLNPPRSILRGTTNSKVVEDHYYLETAE